MLGGVRRGVGREEEGVKGKDRREVWERERWVWYIEEG
jgi:hypothetical protein